MDSKRAALKVGLFVLGGFIVLLGLLFFLSGSMLHPGKPYETYFRESVQGLDVGTAVKFRGVTIGKVTDVGLVMAEYPAKTESEKHQRVYQQVVVRFQLNPRKMGEMGNIKDAVAHGLRVQIAPQGITGLSYMDLSFVNAAQYPAQTIPWTPNSTVIPSVPSTLTQVQDAAEQVLSALSNVDLPKIAGQISSLTAALNDEITTGDAHQAVANVKILLATLNTQVQQADIPGTSAAVRNLAGGPQTMKILAQLNQTTAQLVKISAALPTLVASSQATITQANETTADLQAQLLPMLQDMRATTANLRALSASLQRNPGQVLMAPPPPETKP
ncbi:MAG: MlaD family protein [Acidocella sp.]|nr:MlaD family protein [Acidocella sp.]